MADAASSLGRAIHLRRVALGMKRRELAIAAGLSYPYVSEIENGRKEPSPKALRQLAEALDLAPSELVAVTDRSGGEAADDLLLEMARPSRTPSTFLSTVVRPEPSAVPPDDDLTVLVRSIVRDELARWRQHELPRLVRAALRSELGSGSDRS